MRHSSSKEASRLVDPLLKWERLRHFVKLIPDPQYRSLDVTSPTRATMQMLEIRRNEKRRVCCGREWVRWSHLVCGDACSSALKVQGVKTHTGNVP